MRRERIVHRSATSCAAVHKSWAKVPNRRFESGKRGVRTPQDAGAIAAKRVARKSTSARTRFGTKRPLGSRACSG